MIQRNDQRRQLFYLRACLCVDILPKKSISPLLCLRCFLSVSFISTDEMHKTEEIRKILTIESAIYQFSFLHPVFNLMK